jgi:hypothetical protein
VFEIVGVIDIVGVIEIVGVGLGDGIGLDGNLALVISSAVLNTTICPGLLLPSATIN